MGVLAAVIKFGVALFKHVVCGFNKVPSYEARRRMAICKKCSFYRSNGKVIKLPYCDGCGCWLNLKTTWSTERCPIDKWIEFKQ